MSPCPACNTFSSHSSVVLVPKIQPINIFCVKRANTPRLSLDSVAFAGMARLQRRPRARAPRLEQPASLDSACAASTPDRRGRCYWKTGVALCALKNPLAAQIGRPVNAACCSLQRRKTVALAIRHVRSADCQKLINIFCHPAQPAAKLEFASQKDALLCPERRPREAAVGRRGRVHARRRNARPFWIYTYQRTGVLVRGSFSDFRCLGPVASADAGMSARTAASTALASRAPARPGRKVSLRASKRVKRRSRELLERGLGAPESSASEDGGHASRRLEFCIARSSHERGAQNVQTSKMAPRAALRSEHPQAAAWAWPATATGDCPGSSDLL